MPFIDFADLKSRIDIMQAARLLSLTLKPGGNQQRGPCPACNTGGERALVITPDRGLFYCFPAKTGGDLIKLAAHVKGCTQNEAAKFIAAKIGMTTEAPVKSNLQQPENGASKASDGQTGELKPLPYLEVEHPLVQALGISPATAKSFGSGYAGRGVLRGRLAVPIHDQNRELLAYAGVSVSKEQTPRLLFHNFDPASAIFNAHRLASAGDLYVYRDPLHVLLAVENGISPECVVSFLTDRISAQQFELLAALMHEKKVEPALFL